MEKSGRLGPGPPAGAKATAGWAPGPRNIRQPEADQLGAAASFVLLPGPPETWKYLPNSIYGIKAKKHGDYFTIWG